MRGGKKGRKKKGEKQNFSETHQDLKFAVFSPSYSSKVVGGLL